jgi:hypothetical protein
VMVQRRNNYIKVKTAQNLLCMDEITSRNWSKIRADNAPFWKFPFRPRDLVRSRIRSGAGSVGRGSDHAIHVPRKVQMRFSGSGPFFSRQEQDPVHFLRGRNLIRVHFFGGWALVHFQRQNLDPV